MPGMVTKVSPVDAAVVALAADPDPPSWSARVLGGAALVWCQTLSIPSVRYLARAIGRAPSTVVRHGSLVELYAAVVGQEWARLDAGWFSAHPEARASFFRSHVIELRARDPVLLRLPGLVIPAITTAGHPVPARLAVPWCSLAAFVDEPEVLELSA